MVAEPECELVAGVSRDQGRADAFAKEFGARFAYTSYDEMLAIPEVDAVYIATPNAQHADQVIAAAEALREIEAWDKAGAGATTASSPASARPSTSASTSTTS